MTVASARVHKNMALVLFEGIDTIEKGEYLLGKEVSVSRSEVDDGEGHFIVDLLGLKALDEEGQKLGTIVDVLQNGAQDLYEIKEDSGKTFYVPVVDEFVKDINVEEGFVALHLIEGLR